LNIDSRDGLGYIVSGWYIFVPPGGTLLLRRLHLNNLNFKDLQTGQLKTTLFVSVQAELVKSSAGFINDGTGRPFKWQ